MKGLPRVHTCSFSLKFNTIYLGPTQVCIQRTPQNNGRYLLSRWPQVCYVLDPQNVGKNITSLYHKFDLSKTNTLAIININ